MASRKLVRDLLLTKKPNFLSLRSVTQQHSASRLGLISSNTFWRNRRFSVFNEFSEKIEGEANSNPQFQQSVKELKKKAEELKVAKEDLKVRMKQTTEKLYKQVDGVWTEAEATAKKVSANVKEKISAATEKTNGSCNMLLKDSESPIVYLEKSADLAVLIEGIEDLNVQQCERSSLMRQAKETSLKQIEVTKEPYTSLSIQNLLLYFPSCISVDECGQRAFLSDSNHHRIVVFDGDGKILDCIGSSPGFEDGDFDSAKLASPAASFYNVTEDCLYVADSENHAIRRADMKKRLLETLYPSSTPSTKSSGFLTWVMSKLGMKREDDARSEESDFPSLMFPWHLMQSGTDSLVITNRSFEMLWTMNLTSGKIGEVVKGFPKIREIYGQMIVEKLSHLRNLPHDWLQQQVDCKNSIDGIPYVGFMSSVAAFKDQIMICDTVGQRVVKFDSESGIFSSVEFSNFGVLGLPYWLASSLERVYAGGNIFHGAQAYHLQSFSLFPGRVDIKINIDIPVDVELLEPLQDGCIWRQARGAATVILEEDDKVASINKSGLAQQWYDELDTVAFETPESESADEEKKSISKCDFEDDRLCINCAVNSSPGTSEVIIYAALYLKLKKNEYPDIDDQVKYAARIENIMNSEKRQETARDPFVQSLLSSNRDLANLIFIKPLHVRIKFKTFNHPKADNSKDFILTDSSIEVNVSLN